MKVSKWSVWIPRLARHLIFERSLLGGYSVVDCGQIPFPDDFDLFYKFVGITPDL